MPDVPLATMDDAARFGYNLPADPQGSSLLDRASTRVRLYTKQTVTRVVDDVVELRPLSGYVILPQRPADKPTDVKVDDGLGNIYPVPFWGWNGHRVICPHQLRSGLFGYTWWPTPPAYPYPWLGPCICRAKQVIVTYSHGWTTVPDSVLDVVCSIANRLAAGTPGMEAGVRQEGVGDYNVTYASDALQSASGLLPGEEKTLDRIFSYPRAGTIQL